VAALAVAVAGIVVVSSSSGEAPATDGKISEGVPPKGGAAPETVAALPQAGAPQAAPSGPAGTDGRRAPLVTAGLDGSGAPTGNPGGGSGKPAEKGGAAQEVKAAGRSKHTDTRAVAYFQRSKAAKRVKDIRMVGRYLRIYTDLPESADNSKQAIELCETGLDYLAEEVGEDDPVVFVQAEFGENGNPVLANVLGSDDSTCRVTHPEPGR
jgi:hypothetical protein